MTETSFYKILLNLDEHWEISSVALDLSGNKVLVHLKYHSSHGLCPFTKENCDIYDYAPQREWRHLDTMQYQTWLVARVPRVRNSSGKVSTIAVPWADFSDR